MSDTRFARRFNLPWVIVGVILVSGSALLFSSWAASIDTRVPVVVLRRAVEAGASITADDVTIASIAPDRSLRTIPGAERSRVAGRVAVADLAPGTLLTEQLAIDRRRIADGEAVIAIGLEPVDLPTNLTAGESVLLVRTSAAATVITSGENTAPGIIAWPGRVVSVSTLPESAAISKTTLVLRVAEANAPAIVDAAAAGRLRVALVASEMTTDLDVELTYPAPGATEAAPPPGGVGP